MNDPGLDKPIADAGKDVDEHIDGQWEEEESRYLDPSRWWFAATACPLIAATFGPMASAFNICAISSYWREHLSPALTHEDSGKSIKDPGWVVGVNAVSLVCALAANMALLFNLANKAKFIIAQPVIVIGFYAASIILIILVSYASTDSFRIEPYTEHALTQAYYYGVWAAAIYFVIATLMLFTVTGALLGKYPKKFDLTTSQRTLMLQTVSFMAYLLIGALIFSTVEGWAYLDALYWSDFTLLTIGIGIPFVPTTHTGRSLLMIYAIGGTISVGLIIGSIRAMILEAGKAKMRSRVTEKERRKVVTDKQLRQRAFQHLNVLSKKAEVKDKASETELRRLEFHAMREIQDRAQFRGKWTSLLGSTIGACILWFIGALVFQHTEYKQDWSYFVSMYFSFTSLLTIGYGDYQPYSNSGKAFFVLWSLLAVPTLTVLISDMGDTIVKLISDITNWVGSLFILPEGEQGLQAFKDAMLKVWKQTQYVKSVTVGGSGSSSLAAIDQSDDEPSRYGSVAEIMNARLTKEDRELCRRFASGNTSDTETRNRQFYHWLIVREINVLMADVEANRANMYTYDEWRYFLALLGHFEDKTEMHADPHGRRPSRDTKEPLIGRIFDQEGNAKKWSWMGVRSPLMSSKDEAEWIVEQLLKLLRREMHLTRPDEGGPRPAPVSTDQLKFAASEEGSPASDESAQRTVSEDKSPTT